MAIKLKRVKSELKGTTIPVKEHENDTLEEILTAINKSFHHLLNPPGSNSIDIPTFISLRDEIGVFLVKSNAQNLVNEDSGEYTVLDEFIARIAAKDFGKNNYGSEDTVVQWLNAIEQLGEDSKALRVLSTEIEEFIDKMIEQRQEQWRVKGSYVRN